MTLGIIALVTTILSITTLSITKIWYTANGSKNCNTQHNIMLSVFMLNVVILNVTTPLSAKFQYF